MAKRKKYSGAMPGIARPTAHQLLTQDTRDGFLIRVYASHQKLVFNVYLWADKHVTITVPVAEWSNRTLSDLLDAAMKKAMDFVPANVLPPPLGQRINPN
jgi:hypothetical protein